MNAIGTITFKTVNPLATVELLITYGITVFTVVSKPQLGTRLQVSSVKERMTRVRISILIDRSHSLVLL